MDWPKEMLMETEESLDLDVFGNDDYDMNTSQWGAW
jgi:hypothetical protein